MASTIGVSTLRVEPNYFVIASNGPVAVTGKGMEVAAIVMGLGVVWVELNGRAEVSFGLGPFAAFFLGLSSLAVRSVVLWIGLDCHA